MRGSLILLLGASLATQLALANPGPEPIPPSLMCTLDHPIAIAEALGVMDCGSFVPGHSNMAFAANAAEDSCVRFPTSNCIADFPWESGMLSFWFKLEGFSGLLPGTYAPALVMLSNDSSSYGVWLGVDPQGPRAGLLGVAGSADLCATGSETLLNYDQVLPGDSLSRWHHAVLFWRSAGLAEVENQRVALFIDGQLNSTQWRAPANPSFPPIENEWVELVINDETAGVCSIDDLSVYAFEPYYDFNLVEITELLRDFGGQWIYFYLNAVEPVERFNLTQNHPNPFNPLTTISFTLPASEAVNLQIFDMAGRHVSTLLDEVMAEGEHAIAFDGSALSSGVYFYRLEAGSMRQTQAMTLIK